MAHFLGIDISCFAQAGCIPGVDVNMLVLERNLMVQMSPTPGHVIDKPSASFKMEMLTAGYVCTLKTTSRSKHNGGKE